MPNAGTYRLSDFPLSNYVNSGISDAWILRQYEPQSPDEHIANGRPWDLDRTVFAFRPSALLDALERDDRGSNGPGDLGGSELPTSDAYWSAHMELAGGDAGIRLDDPGFPVLSHGSIRTPVFVEGSAEIDPAFPIARMPRRGSSPASRPRARRRRRGRRRGSRLCDPR
jgi:ADP-glucose pyrophosphorylase